MDSVRAFVDGVMDLYQCKDWNSTLTQCLNLAGFDWMREKANDWDIVDVHSEELEMRSALEFLRPQLNPFQIGILEEWDRRYCLWRDEGFFFKRYEAAEFGYKSTWQDERNYAEKRLGRKIPTSHWWYWPSDEKKEK